MKKVEVIINFMILLIIEKTKYDSIKSGDMALTFVKSELTKRKDNNLAVDLSLKLLYHLRELVEHEDTINTAHFLDRLQILLADHKNLFDIIVVQTSKTYSEESINYKKFELNNFIKLDKIIGLFKIESLRARNPTINFKEFVINFKNKFEEIIDIEIDSDIANGKEEIDLDNDAHIDKVSKAASSMFSEGLVLKTGWGCLNKMLQSGLRRGETVLISALAHSYKSSMVKSLFLQIARLNKPTDVKEGKKPLLIFLSLEEDVRIILIFWYAYLKKLKEDIIVDPEQTTVEADEMRAYIKEHFTDVTNFNIKILRWDPSVTTYKDIISLADKYNKTGYDVYGLFTDYLAQVSTAGCTHGTMGAEYRDLFKRVRNAMTMRNILFVTPHQLSPAAKALKRSGLEGEEFTRALLNKGYFEYTSKLDQEVDVSIFLNKYKHKREYYLGVHLDKHRIPTIVEDKYRYFDLKFPLKSPIIEDSGDNTLCTLVDSGGSDGDMEF